MVIKRINDYDNPCFSSKVLWQHGGYLIDEKPYEVEIIQPNVAVVRGADSEKYCALIEEFSFHAPHINKFINADGNIISEFDKPILLTLNIDDIQPSQFYIDEMKLSAVKTFIHEPDDVVIQVTPNDDRYISLDGHTRLFLAAQKGYKAIHAVISEPDDCILTFVAEAKRRGVYSPKDLLLLPHDEYEVKWNRYCDSVFGRETE